MTNNDHEMLIWTSYIYIYKNVQSLFECVGRRIIGHPLQILQG